MKIDIPGSKSHTNRALIMAALTKGAVTLHNPLFCEDTDAMLSCLQTLGIPIQITAKSITVVDDISMIQKKHYDLFAYDSGTTMRFLLPLLCLIPGTKLLQGNSRLVERPIKELVYALQSLGAEIELRKEGLFITSSNLRGGKVSLNSSISSQFLSALLMISPLLKGIEIEIEGSVISKPYITMTLAEMRKWGIELLEKERSYLIPSGQSYQKKEVVIEGDFSSAGYFFAIAALTKSTLTLTNLNPHSLQPDRKFVTLLALMGNEIVMEEKAITLKGKAICPLTLNMEECPDQVQTLAVLAAFAKGVTTISGVRSLRYKETERVDALKKELAKMGIQSEDSYDTLTIYGGSPHAATIATYGDHRMAMAFAIAGTKIPGMVISNPEVVHKTFPTFWDTIGPLWQSS